MTNKNDYSQMTNTEFVNELMDGYSEHGALQQMVMIDAIEKGLEAILEHKETVVKEYNEQKAAGKFHFINLEAWMQCAEAIQSKFRNKYN